MNASRDDAAGTIRVQSNRGGGCQWRREVGPLGRGKAATLTFVEAWNHDNVPEMRERTQQPWAKGTDVVAKKCSQCGSPPRFFAATIDGAPQCSNAIRACWSEEATMTVSPRVCARGPISVAAVTAARSVVFPFPLPTESAARQWPGPGCRRP